MKPRLTFHRLVQRDMDGILSYYKKEASISVADRFFETFLQLVGRAAENPKSFHPVSLLLRRANIPGFPYHFIYRELAGGFECWFCVMIEGILFTD